MKGGARTGFPCPIKACTDRRTADQVMCPRHWFKVPKPLRDRIWQLYKNERGSQAHLRAIAEAIRGVNDANDPAPTSPAA